MPQKKATNFKPTQAMLMAANALVLAMANRDYVEPIVIGYQKRILERNQFKYDPQWVDNGRIDSPKSHDVILDPKISYLLSESDFQKYLEECDRERIAANLVLVPPCDCPLLHARLQVSQAENDLVATMEGITDINVTAFRTIKLASQAQLVDLTLRLLAPFIDKDQVLAQIEKATLPS